MSSRHRRRSREARDHHIRVATAADRDRLLDLHQRAFVHHPVRTPALWDWRFQEHPAARMQLMLAEDRHHRLVAAFGGIAHHCMLRGRPCLATQYGDSAVDPDARRGLGGGRVLVALMRRMFEEFGAGVVDLGWGYPEPAVLEAGARLAGIRVLRDLVFLVREAGHASADPGPLLVQRRETLDEAVDALWERCRPEYGAAVVRDAAYCTWRYLRHPEVGYRILLAVDPADHSARGLAVLRAGGYQESALTLMDWLVPASDREAEAALMHQLLEELRHSGKDALVTWIAGSHHWFQRFQRQHGFIALRTPYQQCFRTWTRDRTVDRRWLDEHWYCTMGDVDFF